MAKIDIKSSGNGHINFNNSQNGGHMSVRDSSPKYIGAVCRVDRVENGVKITCIDYKGETQEIVYEAIESITTNSDGSLTFTLPDGRTITTGSLIGPQGPEGPAGESGFDAYTEEDVLYLLANGGGGRVYSNTISGWNEQPTLISEAGSLYIYTDYDDVSGVPLAGIKVGDGLAYVIDLPFIDANIKSHMSDSDIHITAEERTFWNNKNRGVVNGENLILTIN